MARAYVTLFLTVLLVPLAHSLARPRRISIARKTPVHLEQSVTASGCRA